jgi:phosphoglycolate phosphatase-like HAD superfamily hydrolase
MTELPQPELIIFDMDGTLIDVSASYQEAAPAAAALYLNLIGLTPPPLTGAIYDVFKRMGGFNDDWDLTTGLLEALLAGLPPADPVPNGPWTEQPALVSALRAAAAPLAGITPPLPDWEALIAQVRDASGGLAGLRRVTGCHNAHLVWRTGGAATTDLVQRVFSEVYFGDQLFADCYGYPARYHRGPGLVDHEQLLTSRATLEALIRHARLGIATGRTRYEAAHALDTMGLSHYFGAIATMNDALEAQAILQGSPSAPSSLLKPHPFLLQRAADSLDPPLGTTKPRLAAYIGDTADDIIAARRANGTRPWLAIAVMTAPAGPGRRQHYLDLGADLVLDHPDELASLWR